MLDESANRDWLPERTSQLTMICCTVQSRRRRCVLWAAIALLGPLHAATYAQPGEAPLAGETPWATQPSNYGPADADHVFSAPYQPMLGANASPPTEASSLATTSSPPASTFASGTPWLTNSNDCWKWQFAPNGLLYPSYLAGQKESRMGTQADYVRGYGWEWDSTLGGRAGLFRYGSEDPVHPEGWQLDVEGAAFPRLDLMMERELRSVDFRIGVPLTYRIGPWETKLAYYHLCSHAGDQFMLDFPEVGRVPYIRDAIDLGFAYCPMPNLRLYSEFGWAFNATGGAKPFDLQLGAELSNQELTGWRGTPFAAIHAHLRQENDFGGNVTFETGWQWRGQNTHLVRLGLICADGMGEEYQFYNKYQSQIGFGLWYDF